MPEAWSYHKVGNPLCFHGIHSRICPHECKGAGHWHAGLLGDNWLYLLELAKKSVVQPGAAVVPAAATLYVMGVELPPSAAAGFDLSCMDKYRCRRHTWNMSRICATHARLASNQVARFAAPQEQQQAGLFRAACQQEHHLGAKSFCAGMGSRTRRCTWRMCPTGC
jgi:hypothetical protein